MPANSNDRLPGLLVLLACLPRCQRAGSRWIDDARVANAESQSGNWLDRGRKSFGQRSSPQRQSNDSMTRAVQLTWCEDEAVRVHVVYMASR